MQKTARRNVRIEALRLAAIVAIAIFHTFQPYFSSTCALMMQPEASATADAASAAFAQTAAAGILGAVNLLGAYGNCVFFAISGFFLIPSAARSSREDDYLRAQAGRTARRTATILASVALYALIALAVSTWLTPLPGISLSETGWLVGGLEFIWVYLAVMVITPLIGWLWERCRVRGGIVVAAIVIVYAVNAYIAFVSPGDEVRGLLEWRKLMSAASYLVAYLAGGALADLFARRAGARRAWCAALALTALAAVLCEIALAAAGRADLMQATSFKSTSALSFALALLSLAACAHPDAPRIDPMSRSSRFIVRAASCILGFYIAQSMFHACWRSAVDAALLAVGASAGSAGASAVAVCCMATGAIASLAVVGIFLALDMAIRRPLLRALHLTA